MKHRNSIWPGTILTVLALCLGLLSGCGSAPQPEDTAEETPQVQAPAAPEDSAPENDPGADTPADPGGASAGDDAAEGTPITALPEAFPMELTFSSGAGAWRTLLTLQPDGSFTGQYSDWDAGGDPSQYPNGVYYLCNFSGTFQDLRQLDETTYSMTLDTLTAQETEGEKWTEDGTQYIGAAPYGLEGGSTFVLYTPEASTDVLTTDALRAEWPQWNLPETVPEGQLGCWLLYNQAMDQAFFSYD